MDQNATISRKALGRASQLGYLYDARKEEFCGISLFKNELPTTIVSSIDVPHTQFEYDFSDTFEQKFKKLDVQAQLKVSVLAVSYDALKLPNATHVVVGIKWGANVVASFEFANKENDLKTDIEGALKANMEKISLSISGSASVQFTEDE
ncbi:unnamed protein product, partial [Rotaria sp. Silwood1]